MIKNYLNKKVVIGTWSLSGDFGHVKKKIIFKSLETAVKKNFFEFDTAPTYGDGKMHEILSDVFKGNLKIKINTKCGYDQNKKKTFKIEDIKRSINDSLNKFGRINTLFLHNPRNEIKNFSKILDFLNVYKKKKLINYIGISLARDFYFEKKIMDKFDFLQDEINLLRTENIYLLKKYNAKIMARSPFASGCLTGKINSKSRFGIGDYRYSWLNDKERLINILGQVKKIKKIINLPLKIASKNFLFQNSQINKIIFGVKNPNHINELEQDLTSYKKISLAEQKKIFELNQLNFYLNGKKGY